jgi:hypothetical protein
LAVGVVSLLGAGSAMAYNLYNVTGIAGITGGNVQIGGNAQSGAVYGNLDNATPETQTAFTSGGLSVSFNANAGIGPGAQGSGAAPAAPYLSGNNNMFFEPTTPVGPDTTPFVYAGNGAGSATFSFGKTQNYFGLLWGSIDLGNAGGQLNNLLTFYSGPNGTGSVVAQIDGSQLATIDPQIDEVGSYFPGTSLGSGDLGIGGTAYVNLDLAGGYESVVATSGNFTFEIDNVAWAGASAPDGGMTVVLLGGAFIGLQALRRKLS